MHLPHRRRDRRSGEVSSLFYRRKVYQVLPEQVEPFTRFFAEYLLPNQLKHGAELVGRWVNRDRTEIMALWRYPSEAAYQRTEELVRQDEMHRAAQARRKELGDLFLQSSQEFLEPTGRYGQPRHRLSAAGFVMDERGEVLLVKKYWRSETWELPGGQVDEGEAPDAACVREVREETGLEVRVTGLSRTGPAGLRRRLHCRWLASTTPGAPKHAGACPRLSGGGDRYVAAVARRSARPSADGRVQQA